MRGEDAHLTALAAVADAYAYIAREKADAAQRALSEIKIFVALLDEAPRSSCWRPCLTPPTAPSAWACARACPSRNPIEALARGVSNS